MVTNAGLFPLELVYTAPNEFYKEQLQGAETADFIKWASSPCFVRYAQIMSNVEKLHWHELKTPQLFGLSVKPHMLEVPARILKSPIPRYSAGTDFESPNIGTWNLRHKRFLNPAVIESYGLIYFPGHRALGDAELQGFVRDMQKGFHGVGMTTPAGLPAFLKGNPQGDLKQIIVDILAKTATAFHKKADLLIFLIHQSSDRLYRVIKNICDVQFGVTSQVMLVEKSVLGRGKPQYIANIALKVNVKRGGINSVVPEPLFQRARVQVIGGKKNPNLFVAYVLTIL